MSQENKAVNKANASLAKPLIAYWYQLAEESDRFSFPDFITQKLALVEQLAKAIEKQEAKGEAKSPVCKQLRDQIEQAYLDMDWLAKTHDWFDQKKLDNTLYYDQIALEQRKQGLPQKAEGLNNLVTQLYQILLSKTSNNHTLASRADWPVDQRNELNESVVNQKAKEHETYFKTMFMENQTVPEYLNSFFQWSVLKKINTILGPPRLAYYFDGVELGVEIGWSKAKSLKVKVNFEIYEYNEKLIDKPLNFVDAIALCKNASSQSTVQMGQLTGKVLGQEKGWLKFSLAPREAAVNAKTQPSIESIELSLLVKNFKKKNFFEDAPYISFTEQGYLLTPSNMMVGKVVFDLSVLHQLHGQLALAKSIQIEGDELVFEYAGYASKQQKHWYLRNPENNMLKKLYKGVFLHWAPIASNGLKNTSEEANKRYEKVIKHLLGDVDSEKKQALNKVFDSTDLWLDRVGAGGYKIRTKAVYRGVNAQAKNDKLHSQSTSVSEQWEWVLNTWLLNTVLNPNWVLEASANGKLSGDSMQWLKPLTEKFLTPKAIKNLDEQVRQLDCQLTVELQNILTKTYEKKHAPFKNYVHGIPLNEFAKTVETILINMCKKHLVLPLLLVLSTDEKFAKLLRVFLSNQHVLQEASWDVPWDQWPTTGWKKKQEISDQVLAERLQAWVPQIQQLDKESIRMIAMGQFRDGLAENLLSLFYVQSEAKISQELKQAGIDITSNPDVADKIKEHTIRNIGIEPRNLTALDQLDLMDASLVNQAQIRLYEAMTYSQMVWSQWHLKYSSAVIWLHRVLQKVGIGQAFEERVSHLKVVPEGLILTDHEVKNDEALRKLLWQSKYSTGVLLRGYDNEVIEYVLNLQKQKGVDMFSCIQGPTVSMTRSHVSPYEASKSRELMSLSVNNYYHNYITEGWINKQLTYISPSKEGMFYNLSKQSINEYYSLVDGRPLMIEFHKESLLNFLTSLQQGVSIDDFEKTCQLAEQKMILYLYHKNKKKLEPATKLIGYVSFIDDYGQKMDYPNDTQLIKEPWWIKNFEDLSDKQIEQIKVLLSEQSKQLPYALKFDCVPEGLSKQAVQELNDALCFWTREQQKNRFRSQDNDYTAWFNRAKGLEEKFNQYLQLKQISQKSEQDSNVNLGSKKFGMQL